MTVQQIQSLMLSWLDDEQQGYFNQTDCITWINLAQRQVQMDLLQAGENWYLKTVETPMIVGQQDYVLPSDFMTLHRLEVILSGTGTQENRQAVTQMTTNQQDLLSIAAGVPTNFYMRKDRFTISPPAQSPYNMRLYYSYRVQDISQLTDVPDVPEQFMEYLAILATFDGFIKDDRAPDNLVIKKAAYREMLENMKVARAQDVSRQVVQTNTYDYGAWY